MSEEQEMSFEDGEEGAHDEIQAAWDMLSEDQKDEMMKLWEKSDSKVNYIG